MLPSNGISSLRLPPPIALSDSDDDNKWAQLRGITGFSAQADPGSNFVPTAYSLMTSG